LDVRKGKKLCRGNVKRWKITRVPRTEKNVERWVVVIVRGEEIVRDG